MTSDCAPQKKAPIAGCPNTTSDKAQRDTEELLLDHYNAVLAPQLYRKNHVNFCKAKLGVLPEWVQGLHCSRPWLIYWTLQAADLLGALPELYATVASPAAIREVLQLCFNYDLAAEHTLLLAEGKGDEKNKTNATPRRRRCAGFGGGAGQMPHLAASYAAIMSLFILEETVEAMREKKQKQKMQADGSVDADAHHTALPDDDGTAATTTPSYNYPSVAAGSQWECLADVPWEAVSNWFEALSLDACPSIQKSSSSSNAAKRIPANHGGFAMHIGGECDVRASYIVATVAAMVGRLSSSSSSSSYFPRRDTVRYINARSWAYVLRCQRFEGGFSCGPLSPEVHGGYGQCALSALVYWYPTLLAESSSAVGGASSPPLRLPNMAELRRWLTQRQMGHEGGFQGRTNKLVDSCYSHWIGTTFVLLEVLDSLSRAGSAPQLLPSLLKGVGNDGSVGANQFGGAPSSAVSISDILHLGGAALLDLAEEQDARAVLATLRSAVVNADGDCDGDDASASLPPLVVDHFTAAEAAKVDAIEAFLADAKQLVEKEGRQHQQEGAEQHHASSSDSEDDANYEDIDEGETIAEAIGRYTNDGAGSLLCNQRALQQYVLKYCQELNVPSAVAPQPGPIGAVSVAAANNNAADNDDENTDDRDFRQKEELLRDALVASMCAQCCPTTSGAGGLMDKPDHPNDSYHTCYSMSGVASMQQGNWLAGLKREMRCTVAAEGNSGEQSSCNSSSVATLLNVLTAMQDAGLLPPTSSAAAASAVANDNMPSLFAPPSSSSASSAASAPALALVTAGFDGLVTGRIQEDAVYLEGLLGADAPALVGKSTADLAAPVQVVRNGPPAAVHSAAPLNPNSTNSSTVLAPTNPMANIAARHFNKRRTAQPTPLG